MASYDGEKVLTSLGSLVVVVLYRLGQMIGDVRELGFVIAMSITEFQNNRNQVVEINHLNKGGLILCNEC